MGEREGAEAAATEAASGIRTQTMQCPRCGEEHALSFLQVNRLPDWEWAICPNTGHPVLLIRGETDKRWYLRFSPGIAR
jgi:hypothetical protein